MNITDFCEDDIGSWVIYRDSCDKKEVGRIKSFNSKYVFVVYKCDNEWDHYKNYTGCATDPEDLILITREKALQLLYANTDI